MTATNAVSFVHPSLAFLAVGLLLALPLKWDQKFWRWLLLLPPAIAIVSVVYLSLSASGDTSALATGHWLGLTLNFGRVDKLTLIFANVFAIQSLIGMLYALHVKDKAQHISAMLYVAGGFGCVFAGDYLTLFVFWELMSIGSTLLIWLRREAKSTAAGFRYFLFHILGGLFLLGGMLLRYKALGTFDFVAVDPAKVQYYDWLILLGFAVNAAVVPLHAWLPDAYPEATVTGAVFMSAFTTKTAVYVLARGFAGFEILAVMGVVMTLYGVSYATIENNARRILSYHIVSQVGYMVAGIGIGTAMTLNGACAHAYAHILYKGLLFMSAGCVLYAAGTAKLTELGGLASRMPWVMFCYMVAAVSISGMPFFNGFVSKTMTIAGAAEAHRTWLALGMEISAVGTFLSVGIKLPYFVFWSKPTSQLKLEPIPTNMYVAMGIASFLCFFIGVYPDSLYVLLPFDSHFVPYSVYNLLQAFTLLGFTGLGFYLMRKVIVPKAYINLDFDYLYRLVGRGFLYLVSRPVAAIDGVWSEVYRTLGLRSLLGMAFGSTVFDVKAIDGAVDGTAYSTKAAGARAAKTQSGLLQDYLAYALILGLGLFAYFWLWR